MDTKPWVLELPTNLPELTTVSSSSRTISKRLSRRREAYPELGECLAAALRGLTPCCFCPWPESGQARHT